MDSATASKSKSDCATQLKRQADLPHDQPYGVLEALVAWIIFEHGAMIARIAPEKHRSASAVGRRGCEVGSWTAVQESGGGQVE